MIRVTAPNNISTLRYSSTSTLKLTVCAKPITMRLGKKTRLSTCRLHSEDQSGKWRYDWAMVCTSDHWSPETAFTW